ncbi:hypothetical protein F4859DRAFT_273214 [Xylaria cf. heliscus]|nr:hypothetical protein F4859DRAFT_273214 [Xylaria cf. heliscus]
MLAQEHKNTRTIIHSQDDIPGSVEGSAIKPPTQTARRDIATMETNVKRKHDASGAQGSSLKRSKGGNQGKWMTPSHKAKLAAVRGRTLEVGDMGFWVTCQRQKEMRAADEILSICEDYGQKLFGISSGANDATDATDEDHEPEDIEATIEKELAAMKNPASKPKDGPFDLLRMNVDCVLFVRTRAPVDPLVLVREICKDAAVAKDRSMWRSRFINKLTPITLTGKATEKGLEDVAGQVLAEHFQLAESATETSDSEDRACSYAIRPTLRAHTTLKRTEVIDKVAKMISKRHNVDLKNPDKVIIIEVFQTFLGMSVVGKDWEAMKRYNLHELYSAASKSAADSEEPKKVVEGRETSKPKTEEEDNVQPTAS